MNDKRRFLVCAHRPWNKTLFERKLSALPHELTLMSSPEELTIEAITELNPEIIFFLDWSWIIKKEFTDAFFCVGFHPAPLPEYKGGSPIQNQIIRGVTQTKLSAFVMDGGIDTGDILLQRDLSLEGHLHDIFERITKLNEEMICAIIDGKYIRTSQSGDGSYYRRRKPSESVLSVSDMTHPLEHLYNFIRMLEDPYPNARLQIGNKEVIFKSAEMDENRDAIRIIADIVEFKKAP